MTVSGLSATGISERPSLNSSPSRGPYDPIAIRDIQEIIEKLKAKQIGVLITDHNVRETLGICDRAYILVDGKVLEEGVPEVIAARHMGARVFGISCVTNLAAGLGGTLSHAEVKETADRVQEKFIGLLSRFIGAL